jgi:hypothetical protein
MPSQIDPTKPTEGMASTADVRANFQAAKDEIEALQGGFGSGAQIGDFLYAFLPSANAIQLVSGASTDILQLDLSPGDWDVHGTVATSGTSGNISDILIWVDDVSGQLPINDVARFAVHELNFGTGGQSGVDTRTQIITGPVQILVSQQTTIYLSCQIAWSGGTVSVAGAIRARRMSLANT